jgi:glycosyltransferase involved in cell wall biosynthesis
VLGFPGAENRTAIQKDTVDAWVKEDLIEYLGAVDDVRPAISKAHCIVLPSYREGSPRSLLEAAAMARPIITTDAVGCRETVDDGDNGFLCHVRDAGDLAAKMRRFLALSTQERIKMGASGRRRVETRFDERILNHRYLEIIDTAYSGNRAPNAGT